MKLYFFIPFNFYLIINTNTHIWTDCKIYVIDPCLYTEISLSSCEEQF